MRSSLVVCALASFASGCFLFHGPPGEEGEPAPDPEPVPDPAPDPGPDPDPGPERDYCPPDPEPEPDGPCACGFELLVHPDEEGRCTRCLACSECEIHIAEDGPVYPDAVVSWQAPGGAIGHGPAIVADGSGTVRVWREVFGFEPFEAPTVPPDVVITLPFYEVDQLVERFRATDRASLPHDGPLAECYAVLAVRECATCEASILRYSTPDEVLPELGCVFDWYDTRLADAVPSTPRTTCDF